MQRTRIGGDGRESGAEWPRGRGIRIGYIRLVNSLWRGNRGLQTLNVLAGACPMALIFLVLEAMARGEGRPDSTTPVAMVAIFLASSASVSKTISDHAFTAQWDRLMRIRLLGASPSRLLGSILVVQGLMAAFSGLIGVILGELVMPLAGSAMSQLDMLPPRQGGLPNLSSTLVTVLLSVLCQCLGAMLAAVRVVRARPDLQSMPCSSGRRRRALFTVVILLAVSAACMMICLKGTGATAGSLGIFLIPLLVWALARMGRTLLIRIASVILAGRLKGPVVTLALRSQETARAASLFTMVVVAAAVTCGLFGFLGYSDANARASLTEALAGGSVIRPVGRGQGTLDRWSAYVRSRDADPLILAPATVVPMEKNGGGCDRQVQRAASYYRGASRLQIDGDLGRVLPSATLRHVQDGTSLERLDGVVASKPEAGAGVSVDSPVCIDDGSGSARRSRIAAVADLPGGMGQYFIPSRLSSSISRGSWKSGYERWGEHTPLALVSSRPDGREVPTGVTDQAAKAWVADLPTGKIYTQTGGDGMREMAVIVYPVLAICAVGVLSLIFTMVEEGRRTRAVTVLLDLGVWRYGCSGTLRYLGEVLSAFFLGCVGSLLVVNLCSHPQSVELYGGISFYCPARQLGLLLTVILTMGLVALSAHMVSYARLACQG
ncbi:hypothetical protein [Bifidobacterium sp. B4142]|uniref:hypothetical protein n=1 Tax=Bifidobacterium sp. B4142 TaxID=2817962 RepID=UPI00226B89CC|nr:hypothetical protein [Bifidobacterium sp. B4142]MCX8688042.1 hypothetical protein [Bifidobacterium sp. B4142]